MRSKVAKQRNQTNSNLLGMDQGAAMRPVLGLALESRGICSGQASGPNIFFRVGPPGKFQASKFSSLQARAARFFSKISSGWARPVYTNRHPQPPAKDIGLNGICQEHYCRTLRQSAHCNVRGPGIYWDFKN